MQKMESFLPSEVARLVYGYLEEEGCASAAHEFLETSVHLQECLGVVKKGRKFSTRIMGRNLCGIFDLLCEVSLAVTELADTYSWNTPGLDKFNDLLKLLRLSDSPIKQNLSIASSGSITSTSMVDETPSEDTSKRKEEMIGSGVEVKSLHVRLPEDINDGIESSREHNEGKIVENALNKTEADCIFDDLLSHIVGTKDDGSSTGENFRVNSDHHRSSELSHKRSLNASCSMTNGLTGNVERDGGGETEVMNNGVRLLTTIKPEQSGSVSPNRGEAQTTGGEQQGRSGGMAGVVVGTQGLVGGPRQGIICQPTTWSNMLHMYQPAPLPHQPTVYMHATVPPNQHNVIFRHENLPAMVSTPSTSVPQPVTAWTKPQVSSVMRKVIKRSIVEPSNKVAILRKYKASQGRPTPKLRPIAPKITQILENGIEVQVMHTKDNPLVDLSEGMTPAITRRCLRSRGESPPPSPLFIDIQDIDDKKN